MNKLYLKTILNQLILLFIIFGGIATILTLYAVFTNSDYSLIYPILFTVGLTLFGTLTMVIIDSIKKLREKNFFRKEPYDEIRKRTIEKNIVQYSKYDFPKTQRIIELENEKYAIEYFDDIFKLSISDVIIVRNLSEPDNEPFSINYKKNRFSRIDLMNKIKKTENTTHNNV
ncbi:hypothetical protein [Luteirhabdus pelagi]|uniref:hypothetical protein n=1 Tax=Luteirhabdus pelagi TaxID=2792783 RepID=UPI001939F57E|nr:hypothetical protein [Luteirhabdus pelagi]